MNCAFYRLPKVFFTDSRYSGITSCAKLLYALLLDRAELSVLNGMYDEQGKIYLYFTIEQVCGLLGIGREKAMKLFGELENIGLVERRRRGMGKAAMIRLKKFDGYYVGKTDLMKYEKHTSGNVKTRPQEVGKANPINTEYNHTENSDTDLSINTMDWEEAEEQVKLQIEYEILSERSEYRRLDEIVAIMTEVMCVCSPTMRIGGQEYPSEYVRHRFSQLDSGHIEYIHDQMDWTKPRIKNIKAYLLTALFHAPSTMEHFYQAEVRADLGY